MNKPAPGVVLAVLSLCLLPAFAASAGAPASGQRGSDAGPKVQKCTTRSVASVMFLGTLLTVQRNIADLDACVAICWNYAAAGMRCKSVNYLKSTHSCELMKDVLDVTNAQSLKYNSKADPNSTYAVPVSCQSQ